MLDIFFNRKISETHTSPRRDFYQNVSSRGLPEETYNGWAAYQQSKLAAILMSSELNRQFLGLGSMATSTAVCESDKWFIMPELLLDDDRTQLEPGPVTTMTALFPQPGAEYGGKYLVDSNDATPGEHAMNESVARELWLRLLP